MWQYIVVQIVLAVIAYALTPKPPKPEKPEAGSLETPKPAEGEPIMVIFGTEEIRSPNLLSYWGQRTVAIKTKGGKK